MRTIACLLALSTACGSSSQPFDPEGSVAGVRGLAAFNGYMVGPGARPMAAGGAVSFLIATLRVEAPKMAGMASSDPTVLEVRVQDPLPTRSGAALVTAHHSGTADAIVTDSAGAEIDRITLTVVDSNLLTIDHGWIGAAPTILADTPVAVHVTTVQRAAGEDTVLVGSGAVSFQGTGAITTVPRRAGDPSSDLGIVRGSVGDGSVVASCPTAQLEVPLHVVPVSALTAVAAPDAVTIARTEGPLSVGGLAGSTPVHGVACRWAVPAGVTVAAPPHLCAVAPCSAADPTADLSHAAAETYAVTGPPGTYSLTCTIQGGLSKTIAVTLQ